MIHVASLTNRIFLASTLLATLSLGFAFYFANARAATEAEAELRRDLTETAALVDAQRAALSETFTRMAELVADLPKLKAGVDTGDPRTVQPLADEYRARIKDADFLVITDPRGGVLGSSGQTIGVAPIQLDETPAIEPHATFVPDSRGVLQIVSVPILLLEPTEVLGRLTVGVFMDDNLAARFRRLTGSEIGFAVDGRVLASSLPAATRAALASAIGSADVRTIRLGDEDYLALSRPMNPASGKTGPVTLVLRSRTERLRFLSTLRASLVGALVLTVLLATILSYGVALTVTRPLSTVTGAMRDVAATGDLTRKVVLTSRAWDDEDARLLASAFNTLTESIARFQRESAQKQRLSALGRLSTVIAHEIRNPLMIIRASLSTLRTERASAAEMREAVADIDGEATRINRIVSEVLDFARPIRFELAEADVNDICRASVAAAWAGAPDPHVSFDLSPDIPPLVTDAERLRQALVNVLTNARNATAAHILASPDVIVSTRRTNQQRVSITVRDRGAGIAPEDMAHIFDPYFTTRRTGTGLGLPIAKNIVEGLGGTIAAVSRPDDGTDIVIELPGAAPEAAA